MKIHFEKVYMNFFTRGLKKGTVARWLTLRKAATAFTIENLKQLAGDNTLVEPG